MPDVITTGLTPKAGTIAHETAYSHTNLPSTGEKAALAGTSGTPSETNKFVTDEDDRLDPYVLESHGNEAHTSAFITIEDATGVVEVHESTYPHGDYDNHLVNTSNPHSVTAAQAGADAAGTAAGVVSDHAALSTGVHGAGINTLATTSDISDHAGVTNSVHGVGASGFEDLGNKGAASGYCGLDAFQLVPTANLGTGAASSSVFLCGNQTWTTTPVYVQRFTTFCSSYSYTEAQAPVEETIGGGVFDANLVSTGSVYFQCQLDANPVGAGNCYIRLYDLGPKAGPAEAPVLVTTLTASSAGIQCKETGLTIVTESPGADEILKSARMYEVTVESDAGAGSTFLIRLTGIDIR